MWQKSVTRCYYFYLAVYWNLIPESVIVTQFSTLSSRRTPAEYKTRPAEAGNGRNGDVFPGNLIVAKVLDPQREPVMGLGAVRE